MTNRVARVRELMKHELSTLLQREFDFEGALVTINDIDVTPDFRHAVVYVGIMGREDLQQDAFRKLVKKSQTLTQLLSKRVILKYTPKLQFRQDDSIERGVRVTSIMAEVDRLTPPGMEWPAEPDDDTRRPSDKHDADADEDDFEDDDDLDDLDEADADDEGENEDAASDKPAASDDTAAPTEAASSAMRIVRKVRSGRKLGS